MTNCRVGIFYSAKKNIHAKGYGEKNPPIEIAGPADGRLVPCLRNARPTGHPGR